MGEFGEKVKLMGFTNSMTQAAVEFDKDGATTGFDTNSLSKQKPDLATWSWKGFKIGSKVTVTSRLDEDGDSQYLAVIAQQTNEYQRLIIVEDGDKMVNPGEELTFLGLADNPDDDPSVFVQRNDG